MARRVGDKELLEKEKVFAEAYASGDAATVAAEKAGYSKYAGSQILKRGPVRDRIMELQRPYTVSWKRLLVKAMHVLDSHLNDANGYARELLLELRERGKIAPADLKHFLKMLEVSASDKNTAVRLITDVMSKINPKSLTDAAAAEDAVMDKDTAIKQILGEDASGTPPDPSAPPDEDEDVSLETIN